MGGSTPVRLSSFSASLPGGCCHSWTELTPGLEQHRHLYLSNPSPDPVPRHSDTEEIGWLGLTQPGRTELALLSLSRNVQPRSRTLLRQGALDLGVHCGVCSLMEAAATCRVGLWQSTEGPRAGLTRPGCEAPGGVACRSPELLELMGLGALGVGEYPLGWPACTGWDRLAQDGLGAAGVGLCPVRYEVGFRSFLETALRCCG